MLTSVTDKDLKDNVPDINIRKRERKRH